MARKAWRVEARALYHCNRFPCAPSMHFRFVTTDITIERFVSGRGLKAQDLSECGVLTRARQGSPSWRKPPDRPGQPCFTGAEPPNYLYLLYDSGNRTPFLFVQNT